MLLKEAVSEQPICLSCGFITVSEHIQCRLNHHNAHAACTVQGQVERY